MKYIYSEVLSDYSGDQEAEYKALKPKLKKPGRVLVTRHYEPNTLTYLQQHKINVPILNMYDYFQGAIDVVPHDVHVRTTDLFDRSRQIIRGQNPNTSFLYERGRKVAVIDIQPLTFQLLGAVNWLNAAGLRIKRDIYDRRGFLSSTQYFHIDGSLGHQILYTPSGKPAVEFINMSIDGVNQLTGIKLLDYQGADYLFANEDELWNFFKHELQDPEGGAQ